jgi:glycyl-tRNA synthetase
MRSLSKALRANCFSSLREPFFNTSTPPRCVYSARSFTTTPPHHRFQAPKRKQQPVTMAPEMTTLKGKAFDRASLESLMRVTAPQGRHRGESH